MKKLFLILSLLFATAPAFALNLDKDDLSGSWKWMQGKGEKISSTEFILTKTGLTQADATGARHAYYQITASEVLDGYVGVAVFTNHSGKKFLAFTRFKKNAQAVKQGRPGSNGVVLDKEIAQVVGNEDDALLLDDDQGSEGQKIRMERTSSLASE